MTYLQDRIGLTNEKNGWHDYYLSLPDKTSEAARDHVIAKLALITSEVSEALEELRDGNDVRQVYYNGTKPEGFPTELADVVIRAYDLAHMVGIDLDSEIERKLVYNATRGHMHGGKRV